MEPILKYEFHWEQYKSSLLHFYHLVKDEHSLGMTRYELTAEEEIKRYLPKSLKVIAVAFVLSIVFGILKGIFDYRIKDTKLKIFGNGSTWFFQSIPDFFIILCVHWLTIFMVPSLRIFNNSVWYNFLAIGFLVSLYPMMYIARITFAAIAAEEGELYIQVAKSKGFTNKKVLYKHIMRNSMQTILTHITPLMLFILSSLLITEYLVGYQGIAYRVFTAIGVAQSIGGGWPIYEPGIIIGTGFCFIVLVMLSQLVGFIIRKSIKLELERD
ncbi:ABC transporter permease subunit [Lederbergia wuyishanensis]|uniref:Oligopeptide transport system permease protein n=1 Tax=Lederbergia wuyishanensis TaxID=1347903 RepID=A0ABU0D4X3_9BACI|nr:ABC transporter permease subunit [Lederbergia wuyishanensis]MCJ8009534.1 ABC transporter permease subunit [Lederbergia wuyishanensis]MDQ0343439.1 oligopeptide transport system permease protein [Lederbergia wuyishanensis]